MAVERHPGVRSCANLPWILVSIHAFDEVTRRATERGGLPAGFVLDGLIGLFVHELAWVLFLSPLGRRKFESVRGQAGLDLPHLRRPHAA